MNKKKEELMERIDMLRVFERKNFSEIAEIITSYPTWKNMSDEEKKKIVTQIYNKYDYWKKVKNKINDKELTRYTLPIINENMIDVHETLFSFKQKYVEYMNLCKRIDTIIISYCNAIWKKKPREICRKNGLPDKQLVSNYVIKRLEVYLSPTAIRRSIPQKYKNEIKVKAAKTSDVIK